MMVEILNTIKGRVKNHNRLINVNTGHYFQYSQSILFQRPAVEETPFSKQPVVEMAVFPPARVYL